MDLRKLKNTINEIKLVYDNQEKISNNKESLSIEKLQTIIKDIKSTYKDNRLEEKLKERVNSIKKAYICNWKAENISFVRKVINNLDPDKGIPTPVLSVCGKGTKEIRFTKYLAYYLDDNKSHGLNNKLLYYLLNKECQEAQFPNVWYQNCFVNEEYRLGKIKYKNKRASCIADIVIQGNEFAIIIEHKIMSSESNHPEIDVRLRLVFKC